MMLEKTKKSKKYSKDAKKIFTNYFKKFKEKTICKKIDNQTMH